MIRNYKYLPDAVQYRLHELVIDFFNRIEFERGNYSVTFLGGTLGALAERQGKIIGKRCEDIYNEIKNWPTADRTALFNTIRQSNDIENICRGIEAPKKIDKDATGVWKLLRDFFIDLYNQVLDGAAFDDFFSTSLRVHFDEFSLLNSEITLCPICGIGELKKRFDKNRDQYDHYLPKALYPLSAINFKNLVPICLECNSLNGKGTQDTIAVSTGKLFYLFDETHKGITIKFHITKDDSKIENIQWDIVYNNLDSKIDEIKSWRNVYRIDERYVGHVKARIGKWYRHYWAFINNSGLRHLSVDDRKLACFTSLDLDVSLELSFIRQPALEGFLNDSLLARAEILASYYSLPIAV